MKDPVTYEITITRVAEDPSKEASIRHRFSVERDLGRDVLDEEFGRTARRAWRSLLKFLGEPA